MSKSQLPDLGKVKDNAAAREAAQKVARERQQAEAMQRRAEAWDKAMQRTFKGIITGRERRAMLSRAAEAEDVS